MIPRYTRDEAEALWSDDFKYRTWLEIEVLACEAQSELGNIPCDALRVIKEKSSFDIEKIKEIEREVKHDVIAFLTSVAEFIGPESRYVHMGMTSSDVLDTCFSYQLKCAGRLLLDGIDKLLVALKRRAFEAKNIACIGRSHGIHAEPITLGLKFARFYQEFVRNRIRLLSAIEEVSICKMSGAVGQFANIDPFVEEYVAKKLGLSPESISSQIIPRDRHAVFFCTLGIIASSIENIAIEIRHSQRTEVMEISEYFSKGQKGSSAMPHKKNPILSENLTGLARVIRSAVTPAFENISLWHERDISHSSVERLITPTTCVTLDFALNRLVELIENLVISQENIAKNLELSKGLVFSQKVMLELVKQGFTREESYKIVQENSLKTWESTEHHLLHYLERDVRIAKYLKQIKSVFEYENYLKNIDYIFNKVFGEINYVCNP